MIRRILSTVSGGLLFVIGLGLIIGLFALSNVGRPGQVSFGAAVDVAATAQAIQAHNRQAELESTLEMKRVAWELELIKKQQEVTAEFNSAAQQQLTDLQAQFLSLQSELNQVKLDLQTDQFKARELQNAIQADAAELTNLAEQVKQLTDELAQTKSRLQATAETLAQRQAAQSQAPIVSPAPAAVHSSDDNDHAPTASDEGTRSTSDSDKEEDENDEHSQASSEHDDDSDDDGDKEEEGDDD